MARIAGRWTLEEENHLRAAWPISTSTEIAHFLDRSRLSVLSKVDRLGLIKKRQTNPSIRDFQ